MNNVPYSSLVEAHQDLLRKGYDRNYNVLSAEKMEDDKGNIWFGKEDGICCYDGKVFKNFTE